MKTNKTSCGLAAMILGCLVASVTSNVHAQDLPPSSWYAVEVDTNGTGFTCPSGQVPGEYFGSTPMTGLYVSNPPTSYLAITNWRYVSTNVATYSFTPETPVPPVPTGFNIRLMGEISGIGQPVGMESGQPNDLGQFVGTEYFNNGGSPVSGAYYWDGASLHSLGNFFSGVPGSGSADSSVATGLDGGTIVGGATTGGVTGNGSYSPGPMNAAIWTGTNLTIQDIGPVVGIPTNPIVSFGSPGQPPQNSGYNLALGIYNSNQIVINAYNGTSLLSSSSGPYTNISLPAGANLLGMNQGSMFGTYSNVGFVYSIGNNTFTTLGQLAGGFTKPYAMNTNGNGHVVGATRSSTGTNGFFWDGSMHYIVGLTNTAGPVTTLGINKYDEILSVAGPTSRQVDGSIGKLGKAFFLSFPYRGVTINLTNLVGNYLQIVPWFNNTTYTNVWTLNNVSTIGNSGEITAVYVYPDVPEGQIALLTPKLQAWNPVFIASNLLNITFWGVNPKAPLVLQGKTNLTQSSWINVATNPPNGLGTIAAFVVTNDSSKNWFFRGQQTNSGF